MPLPRAGHPTARAVKASAPLKTAARRPCVVVVVVVVAATPNYLRQASQNLGKYVRSLSVSAVGHGGVVIHSTVTITELKSILLLTELKSSQNQVYTADCAAFTEVALRP